MRQIRILVAILAGIAFQAATFAASPYLVKDVDPRVNTLPGSWANHYMTIGKTIYFFADDGIHGTELFKSDGTPEGTAMVKDTVPGSANSYGRHLLNLNGTLYFFTYTQLWRSDGTEAGTYPIKDVQMGGDNVPYGVYNGKIYFAGIDTAHGEELWVSDGTTTGTRMVADIDPYGYSFPSSFGALNGKLFFAAMDNPHGWEPYITDGTAAGTKLLKDINPGSASGYPGTPAVIGSIALFSASPANGNYALYKTDGTSVGTVLVKDHISVSSPIAFRNKAFFSGEYDGDWELWTSDGTTAGTVLFKDLEPGPTNKSRPRTLLVLGSNLYFVTMNETNGVRLWRSDGTSSGTTALAQLYPTFTESTNPYEFRFAARNVGGKLVLFCSNNYQTSGFWVSDGTPSGTVKLMSDSVKLHGFSDTNPPCITPDAPDGRLYFTSSDPVHSSEPWVTDGTVAGTHLLKEINQKPYGVTLTPIAAGDKLFFAFDDSIHGNELWASDGSDAGTFMVKDINTITTHSTPQAMACFNNKLYFAANDGVHGLELWCSDGTAAGTSMASDLEPGAGGSAILWTYAAGGMLYFQATTTASGTGIYGIDAAGQVRFLTSIRSYGPNGTTKPYGLSPDCICEWMGRLCLTAFNSEIKLWTSDGTPGGTMPIENLVSSTMGYCPRYLTTIGNRLYTIYPWNQPSYSSDGTSAGTSVYHYFDWQSDTRATVQRTALANRLLVLFDKTTPELWISSGTSITTQLLSNAFQWPQGGPTPAILGTLNDKAYFSVDDGVHGHELWQTDGTQSGTRFFKEIHPSGNSEAANGIPFNGRIYFTATEPDHGNEIWSTDGTAEGTVIAGEIYTGAIGSKPDNLVAAGPLLFFLADDGAHGRELWAIPTTPRQSQTFDIAAGDSAPVSSITAGITADFSANSAPGRLSLTHIDGHAPGRPIAPGGYWHLTGLQTSTFSTILTFTYDPSAIIAAGVSMDSIGLLKSVDGGTTWTRIPAKNDPTTHTIQTAEPQTTLGLYAIGFFNTNVSGPWSGYR